MRTTPQGTGGYPASGGGAANGLMGADFGVMLAAKAYVHEAADQMYKEVSDLMTALEAMSSQWDGAAKTAFYAAWNDWQPKADALRRQLYNIGDGLDSTHKSYSEMELDNVYSVPKY
jgi:WXG100 family type VII secretion target